MSGLIDRSAVLVNFHEATRLEITGIEVLGSILAPSAAVSFPAGLVQDGRQVNYGYFVEPDTPPTPARVKTWGAMKAAFRPAQGYPETRLFRSPGLRSGARGFFAAGPQTLRRTGTENGARRFPNACTSCKRSAWGTGEAEGSCGLVDCGP